MGLELFVCALLGAFFFGGLVAPIGLWLVVTLLQRRRLVCGLRLSGLRRIEDAGDEHAEAPARLFLHASGRRITAAALTRGGQSLWQVRIPVDAPPGPRFALVRDRGARVLPEVRGLGEAELYEGLPWGFRLLTEERAELVRELGARLPRGAARLVGGAQTLLQCAFTGEHIVVEVRRDELTAAGLLRALRRSWGFAEDLGAVVGPLRFTEGGDPHVLVAAPLSGAPLALPS